MRRRTSASTRPGSRRDPRSRLLLWTSLGSRLSCSRHFRSAGGSRKSWPSWAAFFQLRAGPPVSISANRARASRRFSSLQVASASPPYRTSSSSPDDPTSGVLVRPANAVLVVRCVGHEEIRHDARPCSPAPLWQIQTVLRCGQGCGQECQPGDVANFVGADLPGESGKPIRTRTPDTRIIFRVPGPQIAEREAPVCRVSVHISDVGGGTRTPDTRIMIAGVWTG